MTREQIEVVVRESTASNYDADNYEERVTKHVNLVENYVTGKMTVIELSKYYNFSRTRVYDLLALYGVPLEKVNHRDLMEDQVETLEKYKAIKSHSELAELTGLTGVAVSKYFKDKYGRKTKVDSIPAEEKAKWVEEYISGHAYAKIGIKWGRPAMTIQRHVVKLGLGRSIKQSKHVQAPVESFKPVRNSLFSQSSYEEPTE